MATSCRPSWRPGWNEAKAKADAETMVFRIAQESLNNIPRHAQATRVKLQLRLADMGCELIVGDEGVGFDVHEHPFGYGLLGMEERARALGGVLTIESSPGKGITVRLWIQATMQGTP